MRLTFRRPTQPLRLLWERVGLGLAQGLALYGLHSIEFAKTGLAAHPLLYWPLVLVAAFVPIMMLSGLGELRWRTLMVWGAVAVTVTALLAHHDIARNQAPNANPLDFSAILAAAAWLFIAHHLVVPADAERRWLASYPAYFDTAWKHGVQLVLSLAFTGAFWLLLYLGAELFKLIGIDTPTRLIGRPLFYYPATATAFALAVHLTDVRSSLVRGVRTVALTLLSWLLPVMALIAVAFLCALPFTGLDVLWRTRSAAGLLLSAAAALVFLTNAAYQDGSRDTGAPRALQWAGRIAALALIPLVAISAYALSLRIGQYGLTPPRIIAAACTLVAACYALGYGAAAIRPGPWLKLLERTNIATAFVILAVLLALFTPLADPARISVADQVRRLESGKVAPDKFDYAFLWSDGARYGRSELAKMMTRKDTERARAISLGAGRVMSQRDMGNKPRLTRTADQITADITLFPKGTVLPEGFATQNWSSNDGFSLPCLTTHDRCEGIVIDMDGDGVAEVILSSESSFQLFRRSSPSGWAYAGAMDQLGPCGRELESRSLGQGPHRASKPRWNDLVVGNLTYKVMDRDRCFAPIRVQIDAR